jgi:hypothetical protein
MDQFGQQPVILGIGNDRALILVVEAIMGADFFAEPRHFLPCRGGRKVWAGSGEADNRDDQQKKCAGQRTHHCPLHLQISSLKYSIKRRLLTPAGNDPEMVLERLSLRHRVVA